MSDTPNIEKLLDLARKLEGLLADPHPGYISWHGGVHQVAGEIGTIIGMVYPQPAREQRLIALADEWFGYAGDGQYSPRYFAGKLRAVLGESDGNPA